MVRLLSFRSSPRTTIPAQPCPGATSGGSAHATTRHDRTIKKHRSCKWTTFSHAQSRGFGHDMGAAACKSRADCSGPTCLGWIRKKKKGFCMFAIYLQRAPIERTVCTRIHPPRDGPWKPANEKVRCLKNDHVTRARSSGGVLPKPVSGLVDARHYFRYLPAVQCCVAYACIC